MAQVTDIKVDPFNFPMPNRADLMSLSVINAKKDAMKTTTSKFFSPRATSMNGTTKDIPGKYFCFNLLGAVPKLHGNRPIQATKDQWNLSNTDIEGSGPRTLHMGLSNKPDN